MNTKLMELANEVKTRHGYKLAEQIADVAREMNSASLLTRIKWVFAGIKL